MWCCLTGVKWAVDRGGCGRGKGEEGRRCKSDTRRFLRSDHTHNRHRHYKINYHNINTYIIIRCIKNPLGKNSGKGDLQGTCLRLTQSNSLYTNNLRGNE